MEHRIKTPDGRTLAVQEGGDPGGKPVLAHSGTPNSRQLYLRHVTDAAARGIRLISYDRPGYGELGPAAGADRRVGRRRRAAPSAPALGISRLATWGVSGGGPHVLACAALLPDLVAAAASLASLAPYPAEGLDWFAGMGQENVDDFKLMLKDPAAAWAKAEQDRTAMLSASAADLHKQFATLLTPTDAAVMTGAVAEHLAFCAQGRARARRRRLGRGREGHGRAVGLRRHRHHRARAAHARAGMTSSCRSGTGSGSPRGSRVSRPGCSTTTGT